MTELIKKFRSKEWQVEHSSLKKESKTEVTYDECRYFACEDIVKNLTKINNEAGTRVIEIPKGTEYHFIGRVDTSLGGNEPKSYYKTFESRNYVAFSTISNKNMSRYKGGIFFVYDIFTEDIAHIFPMDSDTNKYAEREEDLTWLPSLWLTLKELESLTLKLKVYNQITCKTKRNGEIIKPYAVVTTKYTFEEAKAVAEEFDILCIVVTLDEDATQYTHDLLYDCFTLNSIEGVMQKLYGIPVRSLLYLD